jgi:hypothetical protein
MTEEYAVILSYKVWLWLWQNPGRQKYDCPWWGLLQNMRANCACCEYYPRWCENCPLDFGNSCGNRSFTKWSCDQTNRAASGYIASKLRRYARRKNFNFEMEIVV